MPDYVDQCAVKKTDDELQIVWGEVYAPNIPDSQGDFMNAEEIRKMAYGFLASGKVKKIDVNHDNNLYGCALVESFIAQSGDPTYIEGSWVVGVHIPNPALWKLVKDGKLNGFSMEAMAVKKESLLELDIPSVIKGEVIKDDTGHSHEFEVSFDSDGNFVGGHTTKAEDGHFHMIVKGTVTETTAGHTHRFSFVEGLVPNE